MTHSDLPQNVSSATESKDGRMLAPAAERNADALLDVLRDQAPSQGRALEIASGTGQHVARFATALPGLIWQPTDIDQTRFNSIEAWRRESGAPNLRPPLRLDAATCGWGKAQAGQSLILVVNLLHLISAHAAKRVVSEAALALEKGGKLLIYGPFLRNGTATSAGDRAFDSQLRAHNPEIGYKDDRDIKQWMQEAGFDRLQSIEMPANNLVFVAEMG